MANGRTVGRQGCGHLSLARRFAIEGKQHVRIGRAHVHRLEVEGANHCDCKCAVGGHLEMRGIETDGNRI
jgi:hypothetical protein